MRQSRLWLALLLINISPLDTAYAGRCSVNSVDENTVIITDGEDQSELIILGHNHRNYWALDKFASMVEDAAKLRSNRIELQKKLGEIRSWNNNDMESYYQSNSKGDNARLSKLVKDHHIDFLGVESPFVAVNPRVEQMENLARMWTDLTKVAYGSQYVETNVEKDLLGMMGANWYYAATKQGSQKFEGVESSLLEAKFGRLYEDANRALNRLNDSKNESNADIVTQIVQSLSDGNGNDHEAVVARARAKLTPEQASQAATVASSIKGLNLTMTSRDTQMLTSMKARIDRSGLLIVGRAHLGSMRAAYEKFCSQRRIDYPLNNTGSAARSRVSK